MYRVGLGLLLLGLTAVGSGCAMCSSSDDDTYAAYGGIRQREDMRHGRVGSAFAPAEGYEEEIFGPGLDGSEWQIQEQGDVEATAVGQSPESSVLR